MASPRWPLVGRLSVDRWLVLALVVGFVARAWPIAEWHTGDCIRDECIYRAIAFNVFEGKGLTVSNKGWLPAPGYPYLLAYTRHLTGSMQWVKLWQVGLSLVSIGLLFRITKRVAGLRAGRIAAFLFALNPTIAWFTGTMWIETVYIFFLLAAGAAALAAHDTDDWRPAALAGALLGVAVLFRGIATYLPPLFLLAILWPTEQEQADGASVAWGELRSRARARWRSLAAFMIAMVLTVGPWSVYASSRFGGPMVSDATVGHVMFLGNNDFPPLTFDYGNGMLTQSLFARYLSTGRRPCKRNVPPVRSSSCEVQQAIAWAKRNPGPFLARVPLRTAQFFNPHSFLTRHARWGFLRGLSWWAKEGLVLLIVAFSMGTTILGTVAAWARARGPWAFIAIGTAVYTVAVTAIMYGMTRFRLPIEALWIPYFAMFLADPRGVLDDLRASPGRLTGALITLPPLLLLTLWYAPTGWPSLWR